MITGLDHATIATSKLNETRDFFVEALGLEVGFRPDFAIPGLWLYCGGQPILHLVGETHARDAKGAIDHFSLATNDFAGSLARLDQAGVPYRAMDIPNGAGAQAFCSDPNGVTVEITWRKSAG